MKSATPCRIAGRDSIPTTSSSVLLLVWLAGSVAAADRPPVVPEIPIVLFNGTNFAGFHTWLVDTKREDPRRVFTVTNGCVRISGDGLGYLATEREYQNYHLIVEFRWGATNFDWGDRLGKARDSGAFLHATGPDGNSHDGSGAFMAAIETQIMEGAIGDFLLIRGTSAEGTLIAPRVTVETDPPDDTEHWPFWKAGGRARTLERWGRINRLGKSRAWRDEWGFADGASVEAAVGRWNRLECRCDGDRIRVVLNGRLVNEARDVSPRHGRILLQCEGSEIFYRRVELRPLSSGLNPQ